MQGLQEGAKLCNRSSHVFPGVGEHNVFQVYFLVTMASMSCFHVSVTKNVRVLSQRNFAS